MSEEFSPSKESMAVMERGLEKDPAAQGIDKKENGNG